MTCFPQLLPILVLLVKQVLLCPIPHTCTWPVTVASPLPVS